MAKTDDKTLDLIREVARQKAEIASAERPDWKTNQTFSYNENMSGAINLGTVSKVGMIIEMAAFLLTRQTYYDEAAKTLGVEDPPEFSWCGYSAKDWMSDFKSRINKIQIAAKKRKFEALEERLNKIISPEKRAEMELEAIERDLKK